MTTNIREDVNTWVANIPYWTHRATIRTYYKLYQVNTDILMDRLFKNRYVHQLFWVLEQDTTGFNHLHMLLGTSLLGNRLEVKNKLNNILGGKDNAKYFDFVEDIQQDKLHKYVGYCTKKLNGNDSWGVLL